VAAHLRSAGDGPARLLHRGPDAVYADVAGRCVGVVGTRAIAVPCALRSSLDRLPDVVTATVSAGVLHLDGEPLVVGRIVDVSVPRLTGFREGRSATSSTTRPMVEDLAQQASRNLGSEGTRPNPSIDVASLVGRGDGLTPYGDDVLCGWLAVHRAAGLATPVVDAAILERVATTTLLSATLLDCAMHGEVIPEFAAWLAALGTADEQPRAEVLARVGHTSGRGLLEGATRALEGMERVAA
jgi:Protein of unknown function (DUF2877)